jgi:hypothetical protein
MNLGNVSWDAVAAAGGGAGGLLAIWPLVRAATKRATMRRRLIQSVAVLREIRASGTERPSTIALSRALEEVVDECATYLTVIERNWLRRTRSMFRFIVGIAISTAAVSGLVVLVSARSPAEVPAVVRFAILGLVVLVYGLAGLATIREHLVKRQRIIDASSIGPASSLYATEGPTVVIAGARNA